MTRRKWTAPVLVGLGLLVAGTALAGIQGSKHDFSTEGWSGGRICIPCHTPHHGTTDAGAPLWNHELSTATYTLYSSPTMDVAVDQPGQASKVCLSCHDGTVATDSFGGAAGSNFMTGDANLTTELQDDHPVGIRWMHQTLDTGGGCTGCHFSPAGTAELPFFDGKVECSSCHDAHGAAEGATKLLRERIDGSQICLHCHTK